MNAAVFMRELRMGHAMLRAGNLPAAAHHCKSALAHDPHDRSAYDLQADILSEMGRFREGLRVTRERLEVLPRCHLARYNEVMFLCSLGYAGQAREAIAELETEFGDPMLYHDAQMVYELTFDRPRHVMKRVEHLKAIGYSGSLNLNLIELQAAKGFGHLSRVEKMNAHLFDEGHVTSQTLLTQAQLDFLKGRVRNAARTARIGLETEILERRPFLEVLWAARIGRFPPFWPATLMVAALSRVTARLHIAAKGVAAFVLAGIALVWLASLLNETLADGGPKTRWEMIEVYVIAPLVFLNGSWVLYALFVFGKIEELLALGDEDGKSIDIREDY